MRLFVKHRLQLRVSGPQTILPLFNAPLHPVMAADYSISVYRSGRIVRFENLIKLDCFIVGPRGSRRVRCIQYRQSEIYWGPHFLQLLHCRQRWHTAGGCP